LRSISTPAPASAPSTASRINTIKVFMTLDYRRGAAA